MIAMRLVASFSLMIVRFSLIFVCLPVLSSHSQDKSTKEIASEILTSVECLAAKQSMQFIALAVDGVKAGQTSNELLASGKKISKVGLVKVRKQYGKYSKAEILYLSELQASMSGFSDMISSVQADGKAVANAHIRKVFSLSKNCDASPLS